MTSYLFIPSTQQLLTYNGHSINIVWITLPIIKLISHLQADAHPIYHFLEIKFTFFLTIDGQFVKTVAIGICHSDFNLHCWLHTDGNNLLNSLRKTVQINESLLDSHLETIPSLRTFTTRRFSCSDSQGLRYGNGSFRFEILFLCTSDQVSTHLFQVVQ